MNDEKIAIDRSTHNYKIFISRPDIPESALSLLKDYDLDIWRQETFVPRNVFLQRIAGKNALFIHSNDRIDAEALDAAGENLKVIGTISAGYDHIDLEEVRKRGIKLGYAAGILNDAVAELTIGLLLCATRRIFEANNQITERKWKAWSPWAWMNGFALKNSVIGIFGLGEIGAEVANKLVAFKPAKILYCSRRAKKKAEDLGAVKVDLKFLLNESDIVILTCSLNDETRGILDEEKFSWMKKNAFLVNIGRGSVVNQDALLMALKKKWIKGAALDVMNPEPLPVENELLHLDNCVITPHIGSAETLTRIEMAEIISRNIIAGLHDLPLPIEI